MAINEIPKDFEALAKKAMPEDQSVLLKIIGYDEIMVPQVEFFKRNVDGGLFCINKSISMESELGYVIYMWNVTSPKVRVWFQRLCLTHMTLRKEVNCSYMKRSNPYTDFILPTERTADPLIFSILQTDY